MKPASLLLSAVLSGVMLYAVPAVSGAVTLSFLKDTIAARVPAKDVPAFRAAIGDVLRSAADGEQVSWSSTQRSRRRAPVEMVFTPLQTTQTETENTCRLLHARVTQRDVSEQWQFWFCQQDDGVWKAVGSQLPK